MAPRSLQKEARERLCVTGGEQHLRLTQDHTATHWSPAGAFVLHPPKSGEAQAGAAGACLPKLRRQGWPASLVVRVVGCLVGQDDPYTWFVDPVQASSGSAFPGVMG